MVVPGERNAASFEQAIARLNRGGIEAFNRGDMAACAALYAASGLKQSPVGPVEILSAGDIGCCAGTYLFRVPSERGVAATGAGKVVTVMGRQPDGSRKAVIDSLFADAEPG